MLFWNMCCQEIIQTVHKCLTYPMSIMQSFIKTLLKLWDTFGFSSAHLCVLIQILHTFKGNTSSLTYFQELQTEVNILYRVVITFTPIWILLSRKKTYRDQRVCIIVILVYTYWPSTRYIQVCILTCTKINFND